MTDDRIPADDERDLMAAEHVLGLLDGEEARAAAALLAGDADFAARVAAWEARLAPLLDSESAEPPAALWTRIDRLVPANDAHADAGFAAQLRRWRFATAGASIAAAALLALVVARPGLPPGPPPGPPRGEAPALAMVATLAGDRTPGAMTVGVDRAGARLIINPVAMKLAAGRAAELWVIPADGKARSLGVVSADAPSRVPVKPGMAAMVAPGSVLAISVEPPGGSPTGQATGPIIMTGKISAV